jgi:hypothetical protein
LKLEINFNFVLDALKERSKWNIKSIIPKCLFDKISKGTNKDWPNLSRKAGVPCRKYAPSLRKFGPLENIVYFIAISSAIVKLLLKPRSYDSICQYLI